jgi:hypothetical protein
MAMLHTIRRIFFHLRKHIANNSGVIVRRLFGARNIYCDIGELGPGKGMVEIVFHEITRCYTPLALFISEMSQIPQLDILFREISDIGMLNMRYIAWFQQTNIHLCSVVRWWLVDIADSTGTCNEAVGPSLLRASLGSIHIGIHWCGSQSGATTWKYMAGWLAGLTLTR